MSPRTATLLTALGLLAAGAPLPFLLHAQGHAEHEHHHACCEHEHHEHTAAAAAEYRVPAGIRCSSSVRSLKLMLGGRVLYEASAGTLWEPTLTLPASEVYDIELYAEPADGQPLALSLTLDIPRRETRTVTHWSEGNMHTVFHFSW